MTGGAPLRVAMIGAGMISRYHLTAWQRCAGAEVVALADPIEVLGYQGVNILTAASARLPRSSSTSQL